MVTQAGQTVTAVAGAAGAGPGPGRGAGRHPDRGPGGDAARHDGVRLRAEPGPGRRLRDNGSSAVRIDDGATGVTVQGLTITRQPGHQLLRPAVRLLRHLRPQRRRLADRRQRHLGHRHRRLPQRRRPARGDREQPDPRQRRAHPEHPRRRRRLRRQRDHLRQRLRAARGRGHQERHHRQLGAVVGLRVRRRGLRDLQLLERPDPRQHHRGQRERAGDGHQPGRQQPARRLRRQHVRRQQASGRGERAARSSGPSA